VLIWTTHTHALHAHTLTHTHIPLTGPN